MISIFVTSQGRTATKWLAQLMDKSPSWCVLHEDIRHQCTLGMNYGVVSSPHLPNLYSDCCHEYTGMFDLAKKGVIIRDIRHTCLSMANKMERLTKHEQPKDWYLDMWLRYMRKCFKILDRALEDGALPIDYERFGDVDYVNQFIKQLGIDDLIVTPDDLAVRVNEHDKTYNDFHEIPAAIQQVALDNQWYIDKWKPRL